MCLYEIKQETEHVSLSLEKVTPVFSTGNKFHGKYLKLVIPRKRREKSLDNVKVTPNSFMYFFFNKFQLSDPKL